MKSKSLITPLIFAAITPLLSAQTSTDDLTEIPFEQLTNVRVETVFGASRFSQKTSQAPASISVITGDDLRMYGHSTIVDTLAATNGFYITYDRTYHYLGSRGFGPSGDYNSRTLFVIDGHRFNDNIYDGAVLDQGFGVDMQLVDRIEVIRGPTSSLYGSSAFFGVVNIVTRTPESFKDGELSVTAGTNNTLQVRATAAAKFSDGPSFFVSATGYESDGEDALYYPEFDTPTSDGIARDVDQSSARQVYARGIWGDFSFSASFVTRTKNIPTGSFGTIFGSHKTEGTDERTWVQLNYNRLLDPDQRLAVSLSWDAYNYNGMYHFDGATYGLPQPEIMVNDFADGRGFGGEVLFTQTVDAKHTFIGGFEFHNQYQQKQGNNVIDPSLVNFLSESDSDSYSPFLQGDIEIVPGFTASLGLRHDYYTSFGGTTSPRAGLIWAAPQKTTVKLLYGTAFRAPNVYEFYYNDGNTTWKANPDLTPERISTFEFVVEKSLSSKWHFAISAYSYKIKDLITETLDVSDNLLVFRNLSSASAKGGSFEVEGRFAEGYILHASHSWQDVTDDDTGDRLPNSPLHLFKASIAAPIPGKVFIGSLETRYNGPRFSNAGADLGGYWVFNATLSSAREMKGVKFSASVRNLFGRNFSHAASGAHAQDAIRQDGVSVVLKGEWRF